MGEKSDGHAQDLVSPPQFFVPPFQRLEPLAILAAHPRPLTGVDLRSLGYS